VGHLVACHFPEVRAEVVAGAESGGAEPGVG